MSIHKGSWCYPFPLLGDVMTYLVQYLSRPSNLRQTVLETPCLEFARSEMVRLAILHDSELVGWRVVDSEGNWQGQPLLDR